MSVFLQLKHLRKSINGGERLFDIDEFSIRTNTCIVLSGRNGAGKTTLLKILAGLDKPDHADILYDGEHLPWKLAQRKLRHDVVYLHQQPYMFDKTVEENIAYGLHRSGLKRAQVDEKVDQALQWAQLSKLATRNARQLSGGEKQRVALTRARVLSPRLLLLDEPLASMDINAREQTIHLIKRLKSEGVSSIVTSHEPHISTLIGDEHRHLCKTGPCRYSIVKPFLFQRNMEQGSRLSRQHKTYESSEPTADIFLEGNAKQENKSPVNRSNTTMKKNTIIPKQQITAVILAGGLARRMSGQDKGLIEINGRAMIEHIITALTPQVGGILINANRNLDHYRRYAYPVIEDLMGEFFGPLVGMASGMQASDTDYLLTVPCDSPFIPPVLAERLFRELEDKRADISVAHDSRRMQPVFALLRKELLPSLMTYLEDGGRKIDTWYAEHRLVTTDFSDWPDAFININTPDDKESVEQKMVRQKDAHIT
ncbi:MAG: molybdenum cofactor guanylyltransferase MobA [Thiogranum sp.]